MALPMRIAAEEGRAATAAYAPQSLQAWGRDLSQVAPSLEDVAATIEMVARHGEEELPANSGLVELLRGVATQVRAAASAAEELPGALSVVRCICKAPFVAGRRGRR